MEIVPSWPAVRREVVIAMPFSAARVVPWGALTVAMLGAIGVVVRLIGSCGWW